MEKPLEGSEKICVFGASEHNLKNVTIRVPRDEVVVMTGPSGSGKTTLLRYVIGRVASRRFNRLRGRASQLQRAYSPAVEDVQGLPACLELQQEPLRGNIRSTIGTYAGIVDLLSALLIKFGVRRTDQGDEIIEASQDVVYQWVKRNHPNRTLSVARIREEMLSSTREFGKIGFVYVFDVKLGWCVRSAAFVKTMLPAVIRYAIPCSEEIGIDPESVANLAGDLRGALLWIVGGEIFVEEKSDGIAVSDPVSYVPVTRRVFSSNSDRYGSGRCHTCNGLGVVNEVRGIVTDEELPLLGGGLRLPMKNERFVYFGSLDRSIRGILVSRGYSANAAWRDVDEFTQLLIVHGTGEALAPEMAVSDTMPRAPKRPFIGIKKLILQQVLGPKRTAILQQYVIEHECTSCQGTRFNRSALSVSYRGWNIGNFLGETLLGLLEAVESWLEGAPAAERRALERLKDILIAYVRLSLGHLSVGRVTSSLSGGESQRMRLGNVIAANVKQCCYLLDEPSRGLHPADAQEMASVIHQLKTGANSVVVVDHNPIIVASADHCIGFGPGGGPEGGVVVYEGPPKSVPHSLEPLPVPAAANADAWIRFNGITCNNVINAGFAIPLGRLTAVVGVSGSGKSSAILNGVVPRLGALISGEANIGEVLVSSGTMPHFVQSFSQRLPTGNSRSVVGTYSGLMDGLRDHFSGLPVAEALGLTRSDFSFNADGACDHCHGTGAMRTDDNSIVWDERCPACDGSRYKSSVLMAVDEGCSIVDIVSATVNDICNSYRVFFSEDALKRLKLLSDLGLGHLSLIRPLQTLSPGERQRLELGVVLGDVDGREGAGVLVLDEPTAGLSAADASKVFHAIACLARRARHTVIAIEHRMEILPRADWIIEFGPMAGKGGGKVVFEGAFDKLVGAKSATGAFLQQAFENPLAESGCCEQGDINKMTERAAERVGKVQSMTRQDWLEEAGAFESLVCDEPLHSRVVGGCDGVLPTLRVDSRRFARDVRAYQIVELFPKLLSLFGQCPQRGIKQIECRDDLEELVAGARFGFSPISLRLIEGGATREDLVRATKRLSALGFRQIWIGAEERKIQDVARLDGSVPAADVFVVCEPSFPSYLRRLALGFSQGVVRLKESARNSDISIASSRFIFADSYAPFGLPFGSPHIGDCSRSDSHCVFCRGNGLIPTYDESLIWRNQRASVVDDEFWHPAVLRAIRSVRREEIGPAVRLFRNRGLADFGVSMNDMSTDVRFMFMHGLPWRRFLKANAGRADREQDFLSWRGVHEYVYSVIGRIEKEHRERLVASYGHIRCPKCAGTGMGREALFIKAGEQSLVEVIAHENFGWLSRRLPSNDRVRQIIEKFGIENVGLGSRLSEMQDVVAERLILAGAALLPLQNLNLVPLELASGSLVEVRALVQRAGIELRFGQDG